MSKTERFRSDARGLAAIEFAFFAGLISVGMLNVTDIAVYIYQRMQVEYAAQAAAQAAWKTCTADQLPATKNCSALNTALQAAVQSTALGTRVSLQPGFPSEAYYCANSSNVLQYMSDVNTKPPDCTAAGTPGLLPGDYVTIATTFAYAPLFPGLTVAGTFATPITKTTMMRLD